MGVSSEQSSNNMNRFVVACAFVACVSGAPQYLNHGVSTVGHASYAGPAQHVGVSHGATVAHGAPVASAPVVTGQTHQTYAAGPPVVEQHTEYGVVGSQVVQTGHASVIGGYTHVPAGQEVIPQPATSYVAGAPQTLTETRPLAPPVIPHAAPYVAAIPPAPVPAGPAPADTVVQQKILAPVRTHTRITPQQTNIIPQLNVQNYNVDVPVHVPVPVERTVIVNKHVPEPYEVPVPRAVPVPAPYKVHPVQEIVETPHIHHATYETHSSQAVVTAHATPVHAVSHVPVAAAAAAPVAAAAPAVAAVGYAGYAGHAVAAPAVAYAGHAVAAPAVAAATTV